MSLRTCAQSHCNNSDGNCAFLVINLGYEGGDVAGKIHNPRKLQHETIVQQVVFNTWLRNSTWDSSKNRFSEFQDNTFINKVRRF